MTRRTLLQLPAALAQPGRPLAYIATYSNPEGPEGAKGRGSGIYLVEQDPNTGALHQRDLFATDQNPSWLTLNSARDRLYSANETQTYRAEKSGSVSAWSIDRATGRLTLLNTESSRGAGPCYVSVHPNGRHLFAANYHGGTIAVLPILPTGALAAATDVHAVPGRPGPDRAHTAPPGSFAISGHDKSHAHMIQADPTGRYVLSADLGLDRIFIWRYDATAGKLAPNDPPAVELPPGDGPRHFAFHPNGRWFYSLQEEASTIVLFDWNAGHLTARQTLSTLPKSFAGTNFTSEIVVSPDARSVYAANRLHDTVAWFSIGAAGDLTLRGEEWTRGDYPRSFTIDPSGRFLYTCNQRADAVACFRRDAQTGALSFTGHYTPVGTPAQLVFLT